MVILFSDCLLKKKTFFFLRELLSSQPAVAIPWVPTPIVQKKVNSKTSVLVSEVLQDDSSDDEYVPAEEEVFYKNIDVCLVLFHFWCRVKMIVRTPRLVKHSLNLQRLQQTVIIALRLIGRKMVSSKYPP